MDDKNNIFEVIKKNHFLYLSLLISCSLFVNYTLTKIDFTFFAMMNPRQITLMNVRTKSLAAFTYPKDSIVIYQTRCSSKDELLYFVLACVRLKKICDAVQCKVYIILRKPTQMKEDEFLNVLDSELPHYCDQLNLKTEFGSLEMLYDFNNTLNDPTIMNQGISSVVMHRNGRRVSVSSCSPIYVKPFHEQEQVVFGPDMPEMIEHATNGRLRKFLLEESTDPKANYIKKLIAQCGEPNY